MVVEQYEEEKTKAYDEHVLNRLHRWGQVAKGGDEDEGMRRHVLKVRDLIARLAHLDPDMPVVIRDGVGWSGVANYHIGSIDEGIILASMNDDYDEQRDELRKGEAEAMTVVVLTKEGFEPETVREWD